MGVRAEDVVSIAQKLAASVTCSRERFEEIYDSTIATGGPVVKGAEPYMAAILDANFEPPSDKRVAFARAFEAALRGNWHKLVIVQLIKDKSLKKEALEVFKPAAGGNGNGNGAAAQPAETIVPQAVIDTVAGFDDPIADASGLLRTAPKVCHVRIQKGGAVIGGTGFIVGPQSVLTAWHVVAPLLDPATGKELPGSHKNLKVVFDYFDSNENGEKKERKEYDVVENWLGEHSSCDVSERPSDKGIREPDILPAVVDLDHLDFAVIRVKGSPGRERGVVPLREDFVQLPKNGGVKLMVFQHPRNNSQKYTPGSMFGFFGAGEPPARMRHRANTDSGSSGGLCTDREFKGIGLHQATVINANGDTVANQAVPVAHIIKRLQRAFDIDPEFEPLWELIDTRRVDKSKVPVVGRDDFQESVWRVARGEKRIVAVRGLTARTGLGFSTQILRALLTASDVVFIELTADEIGLDPVVLATLLLRRCGGELGPAEKFPAAPLAGTATAAWLRDQLLPDLAARMRAATSGRQVWIVLGHLDKFDVPDDNARAFFMALMTARMDAPLLRFLLLGPRNSLPGISPELVEDDSTGWPTQTEFAQYIRRYCIGKEIPITDDLVDKYASDTANHATRDVASAANQWEEASRYLMEVVHPELQKRK